MILIDFEYGGFNPLGYDIANYWNECVCDNQTLVYYHSNFPNAQAREAMCKEYLKTAHEKGYLVVEKPFEEHWESVKESFVKSVEKLTLVNSLYWSTWAIMMLPDESVCDDNAWQWAFLKGRNETSTFQKKEFNIAV